jgi:hypothetical protein
VQFFEVEPGIIGVSSTHHASEPNPLSGLGEQTPSATVLYETLSGESAPEALVLAEQTPPEAEDSASEQIPDLSSDGEGEYAGPIVPYHSESEANKFASLYCHENTQFCRLHKGGWAQRTTDEKVNYASAIARPYNGNLDLVVQYDKGGSWRTVKSFTVHEDDVGHIYYYNRKEGTGPVYKRHTARMKIENAEDSSFDYAFSWRTFGPNTVPGTMIPEWD